MVTVDIAEYEHDFAGYVRSVVTDLRTRPTPVEADVRERAKALLGADLPPLGPNWAREVHHRLDALMEQSLKGDGAHWMQIRHEVMDLGIDLVDLVRDPQESARRAEAEFAEVLDESRKNARALATALKAAMGRVKNWNGSDVHGVGEGPPVDWILRTPQYDRPVSTFSVHVGSEAGFTVFITGSGFEIDDVLEGGDEDFFGGDPGTQADYFNLIKELRQPGSSGRGRDIVLWTARPVKDRAKYERATHIPSNLFLTTDEERAYGLAQEGELGGGVRDVYRVVVNTSDLVMTLDNGRVKDYQAVGSDRIPVKNMTLVHPAPDTAAGRVAVRWLR